MSIRLLLLSAAVVLLPAGVLPARAEVSSEVLWARQIGTPGYEVTLDIETSKNSVLVLGETNGSLARDNPSQDDELFLQRWSLTGELTWQKQFTIRRFAIVFDLGVDPAGNSYIAGAASGVLDGQEWVGDSDAFVRKYDSSGAYQWTRMIGTEGADRARSVAATNRAVYVAGGVQGVLPGETSRDRLDGFIARFDPDGTQRWVDQFGTARYDSAEYLALAKDAIYVAGSTSGRFRGEEKAGGIDTFVRRIASNSQATWTRMFGSTVYDQLHALAANNAGAYLTGWTDGDFEGHPHVGWEDAFVQSVAAGGEVGWGDQYAAEPESSAIPTGIAASASYVHVIGAVGPDAAFPGEESLGSSDIYRRTYTTPGVSVLTDQFGTEAGGDNEGPGDIAARNGVAYLTFQTTEPFAGQDSHGGLDVWLLATPELGPE
ncbi:MAG: hypothetical protein WD556_13400 [Actinomycetota bacterium]